MILLVGASVAMRKDAGISIDVRKGKRAWMMAPARIGSVIQDSGDALSPVMGRIHNGRCVMMRDCRGWLMRVGVASAASKMDVASACAVSLATVGVPTTERQQPAPMMG